MVLREVTLVVALGIGVGLPLAWWLTRFVRSQLFGVEPRDPLSFALAGLGLAAVSLIAGALPAHRASRVNPVRVLRCE
jgi:ABC-type antimicrobial peptide transport system permease subunit